MTSNMHEGTRKGRIYPDVWKRLPIKVASAERQQQIAKLVEAVQEGYRQVDIIREDERQQIQTLISSNLEEIEGLVQALYGEPADTEILESINAKMTYGANGELF
jgi:uncharacterized protein YicC (UPF0701 family)